MKKQMHEAYSVIHVLCPNREWRSIEEADACSVPSDSCAGSK